MLELHFQFIGGSRIDRSPQWSQNAIFSGGKITVNFGQIDIGVVIHTKWIGPVGKIVSDRKFISVI